jgi:hypothetical protein
MAVDTGTNSFRVLRFVVPDFLGEDEIEQYLFDLFHESAIPGNGDVRRIA